MRTARKPPRRPRSLACSKVAGSVDVDDDVDIPPDPKSSNTVRFLPDRPMRCLLLEIDHMKLATQLTSHPSGRSTALLLQALRQQISIASSDDYTKTALEWIAKHDLLMLKMKKNSVFCRVMQADGVESREEMSRLINTMSSFTRGRQYFCAHLKLFLPTVIAILRGRRLPSTTHDQLVACLQKLSVRIVVQREMLNFGMLEWIINLLEQRHSAYAVEYGMGIAINLAQNPFSQPLQLRFADSIAAAVVNVLSRDTHGPSCTLINSFVFVALGCSRVKLRAKETKLYDALKSRIGKRACPHCDLHIPYLCAIIAGDVDVVKVPQAPTDSETDAAGDACEREVDSTDPLRPTSNELSGARLLLRRAAKDSPVEELSVPGLVPRHSTTSPVRVTHGSSRTPSQTRMGTATSQHTFVIETERRRPLFHPIGLSEYAIEYKKVTDVAEKARREEELRIMKEKEKEEREKERIRSRQTTARKPPAWKKSNSKDHISTRAVESAPMGVRKKAPLRATSLNRNTASSTSNSTSPQETDKSGESSPDDKHMKTEHEKAIDDINADDYTAVFGARPKVARTPDHVQHSHSFF